MYVETECCFTLCTPETALDKKMGGKEKSALVFKCLVNLIMWLRKLGSFYSRGKPSVKTHSCFYHEFKYALSPGASKTEECFKGIKVGL